VEAIRDILRIKCKLNHSYKLRSQFIYFYHLISVTMETSEFFKCERITGLTIWLEKSHFILQEIGRRLKILNTFKWLTPWSWALIEKPLVAQPLKNFPPFYRTRRFIPVFTKALYRSLFWARSIQSIPPHPLSLRYILSFLPPTSRSS
jgi:hypothetical protein